MFIMSILRMIFVLLVCLPVGYLFLYLLIKFIEMLVDTQKNKRKKEDEKRSVYFDRRS